MKKDHTRLDQSRAPIYEALETFRQMRVVPFDVPGHKRGRGNPELTAFLGQQCVGVDVNSMKPLDLSLIHISVEDDDGRVDGVTHDGQHARDERGADGPFERCVECEHHQHVVHQRQHRAGREPDVTEPEPDVNQHADGGEDCLLYTSRCV